MNPETFIMRKNFLEEFYNEDRVNFLSDCRDITLDHLRYNLRFSYRFHFDTEAIFKIKKIKNYDKFFKSFLYFLYSYSYREKFLQDFILILETINIRYYYNNICGTGHFQGCLSLSIIGSRNFNFLREIQIKENVKEIKEIRIELLTKYENINYDQYIALGGVGEDINYENLEEMVKKQIKKNIINSTQTFNSKECIICLTNPPQVLFCNCGHLCYCSECEKLKTSNKCPICKTENEIIRMLE